MNNYEKYCITEAEYDRITKSLDQQHKPVLDIFGSRWVKCRVCGMAKNVDECWTYGGIGRMNIGECEKCFIEKGRIKEYTK